MHLCIFNPEHDLCLAKGRVHYVPPRSAVDFARRDAGLMQVLYPDAHCCSVYDLTYSSTLALLGSPSPNLGEELDSDGGSTKLGEVPRRREEVCQVTAWGWDAVVKHELLKRGVPASLLPSDEEIATIRELQHRSTILPLQEDSHEVHSVEEMEELLCEREHWVMKAPWSGAGRGLRWVHGSLTPIDRDWLQKTVATQRCVIAEPRREVVADVALEYFLHTPQSVLCTASSPSKLEGVAAQGADGGVCSSMLNFLGYSYFRTGSGVYKENIAWFDERIETTFSLLPVRERVEHWLEANVCPRYRGPLGVDLMVCADGCIHVSEINFRHTMGMVAHERIKMEKNYGIY